MEIVVSLLKNKWFWIILAIIIILVVLNRNWNIIKDKLFDKRNPSYTVDEEGNKIQVTELDKIRLDKLVVATNVAVNSALGMDYSHFEPLLDLTDQELEYVAKSYKSSYNVSLYQDIDDEWLPFTQGDEKLQARLDKLGYKS